MDSYNSVLEAWSHSESQDTLTRISKIYQHLEENPETDIVPTIQTINTILAAHAKQVYLARDKEAVAKAAHAILNETLINTHLEPTQMTYTSVMEAYSKCGTLQATLQVEQLLEQLQQASLQKSKIATQYTNVYIPRDGVGQDEKFQSTPHGPSLAAENGKFDNCQTQYTNVYGRHSSMGTIAGCHQTTTSLANSQTHEGISRGCNVNTTRPNIVTYNAGTSCVLCKKCNYNHDIFIIFSLNLRVIV